MNEFQVNFQSVYIGLKVNIMGKKLSSVTGRYIVLLFISAYQADYKKKKKKLAGIELGGSYQISDEYQIIWKEIS